MRGQRILISVKELIAKVHIFVNEKKIDLQCFEKGNKHIHIVKITCKFLNRILK